MTLFALISILLLAATLAILVWRGPAVAHVTDPATAAAAVARPTRGLVIGLAVLILAVAGGGYAWIGSPRLLPVTPDAPPGPGPAADAQLALDDALASGDVAALARMSGQILGRVAFQVLAGLTAPGPRTAKELYRGAPYGVGYFAGVWQP